MSAHREHKNKKGDVAEVRRVAGGRGDLHGIAVRLVGHAFAYVVAIVTGSGGPRLVDLRITAETDAPITPDVLRAIPSRRLAHAAAQFAASLDGRLAEPLLTPARLQGLDPDDPEQLAKAVAAAEVADAEDRARPDERRGRGKLGDDHYRRVAELARAAVAGGYPVRETVAAQMAASVPTLDRWIRRAKDLGYLGEDELPRRKKPGAGK